MAVCMASCGSASDKLASSTKPHVRRYTDGNLVPHINNGSTNAVSRTYLARDHSCTLPMQEESPLGGSQQKGVEAMLTVVPNILRLVSAAVKREQTHLRDIRVDLSDSLRASCDNLRDIGEPVRTSSVGCMVHAGYITLHPVQLCNSKVVEAMFDVETCRICLRS